MTMLEKVETAIANEARINVHWTSKTLAKAAVEAMRHPSIEMVEAGYNAHPNSYGPGLHPAVYQYRTMIDAALKE